MNHCFSPWASKLLDIDVWTFFLYCLGIISVAEEDHLHACLAIAFEMNEFSKMLVGSKLLYYKVHIACSIFIWRSCTWRFLTDDYSADMIK